MLQSSVGFGTVLYLVRTKNMQRVRDTFLQGLKKQNKTKNKQISTYTGSQYGLSTRDGSLIIEGSPALVSQEGAT